MANYSVMITDNGGDEWSAVVRTAPTTEPSGGTALANGASTEENFHVLVQRAVEAIKNHISANGHL
jgi:hypothetical protein